MNQLSLEDITYLICRGGWPKASFLERETALDQAFDYYDAVIRSDISGADGARRNPERVKRLMRSYARNQGSQISIERIRKDMLANDTESLDGQVYHYRDKYDLECDAVIHLRNASYGLVEIKLGQDEAIAHGANTLKSLGKKINTDKMKEPSFLMVLTAVGNYAYRRADGVYVVPIGCLKD